MNRYKVKSNAFPILEKIETKMEYDLLKYQQEWRAIIISNSSIDSSILDEIINSLYSQIGYALPQIQIFGSPHAAVDFMVANNISSFYYLQLKHS